MTREKEIKKEAFEYADKERIGIVDFKKQTAFIDGAKWADAHPHWISVEDELPKERDWYLIYDTNMGHDVCMWYGDCWGNCYKVTHWMPLQAPPKSSCSEFPTNCKKLGMKGYENVIIHEGNTKGGER